MKKILFLFFVLCISPNLLLAQKPTKDEIVHKTTRYQGSVLIPGPRPLVTNYAITCSYELDDNYNKTGTPQFMLFAHDDNYDYSDEFEVFFTGNAKEFDTFILKLIDFLQKADNGMNTTIENKQTSIVKDKLMILNDDGVYHKFKQKELKNIQKKFREYCKKNMIDIQSVDE